jgi:hypothetical protein
MFPVRYEVDFHILFGRNLISIRLKSIECVCVFHTVLPINSDCFPKRH